MFFVTHCSILVESNTISAQDLSDVWFEQQPTDLRWTSTEFLPVYPQNSLTHAKTIDFNISGFTGTGCMKINDAMLAIKAKLTKADCETKPADGTVIAPVNNVLHSLISSVSLYLNNTLINNSSDLYHYKSYLFSTLSYGADSKFSFLQGSGYYPDTASYFDDPETNTGFQSRSNLFKSDPLQNKYHGEEVQFAGRLYTDLVTSDCPVPPGVNVRIVLTLASPDFVLQVPSTDNNSYKILITDAVLHMPIAALSPEVYNRFERKLSEKEACIYYRRIEMITKSIPKGTTVYNSETLFAQQANPCKLIVGLVDTSVYVGNFKSTPYNFKRLWSDATGTSFVESMDLLLNSKTLDGLCGKATKRDDMLKFLRMQHFLMADNNMSSNNLSYNEFMHGTFLAVFDVSTSGQCGFDHLVPATRMGSLRLSLEFSSPSKQEITVIMFAEFPSLVKISKRRQISLSYY